MNNLQNFWTEKITIGNLNVSRFLAAPLDGITDSPFRQFIRHYSPDVLLMSEMRHVAYVANAKVTTDIAFNPSEKLVGYQFSANKEDFIEYAVNRVLQEGYDLINLNCGCPSRNVTKSGSGSALMADLPRMKKLVELFNKVIDGRVPMTVKIRAGYKEKNAIETAKMLEDLGVACLIIHPRTQPEASKAPVDFELAKRVKEAVKIPVIFSGEIVDFASAKETYERTGVDGFMIGRALWGIPWKIREIVEASQGNTFTVNHREAIDFLYKHFNTNQAYYPARAGYKLFKKQLSRNLFGIPNHNEWRSKLVMSETAEEMKQHIQELYEIYVKNENNF